MSADNEQFYLRYYSGHRGRFGHEFLGTYVPFPFFFPADHANNRVRFPRPERRQQRHGALRQQLQLPQRLSDPQRECVPPLCTATQLLTPTPTVCVSGLMIKEIKRIIKESEIMKYPVPPPPRSLPQLPTDPPG
jgi:protein mago nashi